MIKATKESLLRCIISIWILYAFSIFVVYFLPPSTKYPYFLLLLFLAYRSKKDFWWISFFILLFAEIGGLFPQTARFAGAFQRLPVYNLGPIRVPLYDLVLLMILLKAIRKKPVKNIYSVNLLLILGYIIILYIISVFLGMSLSDHLISIRAIFNLSLFYSLPRLLRKEIDFGFLFGILFSAVFVMVALVTIEIFTGFRVGEISGENYKFGIYAKEIRLFYSPYLVLLDFIIAIYFYFKREESIFSKTFLTCIIILSYILIILSATRGWLLAFSTMLITTFIVFHRRRNKIILYTLPLIIILLIGLSYSPRLEYVLDNIFERLSTIGELWQGDPSAGGTLSRLTVRAPRMLKKVSENPITGFGFSNEFYKYSDNHVGPVHQLLQMGIIGIFLYLLLFIEIFKKNRSAVYYSKSREHYAFLVGLIGLLIIHFTSTTIFAISPLGNQSAIFEVSAILLTYMNFCNKKALKGNEKLSK